MLQRILRKTGQRDPKNIVPCRRHISDFVENEAIEDEDVSLP